MVDFAPTVLLVSQDPQLVQLMDGAKSLSACFTIENVRSMHQVALHLRGREIALVVVDINEGTDLGAVKDLLWSIMELDRPVRSLLLLHDFTEKTCDDFRRAGATCCRPRSVSHQRLCHALEALTFEARTAESEAVDHNESPPADGASDPSFYICPQLEEAMKKVRRVAPHDTTVLLTGETGTGKTHLAKFIHELSQRDPDSFKVVECSSLSPTLIESQLFGHVRGAFSGTIRDSQGKLAAAGNGTLVLDEINSLSLDLQSKLLRAVEDRVFEPVGSNETVPLRARLITITNSPLEEEVAAGRFRRDLYYRLDVVRFRLPALRECCNAVAPLAQRFFNHFAKKYRRDMGEITPQAMHALERYHWPGNVRELRSVIEAAVSCSAGTNVDLEDLPPVMRESASPGSAALASADNAGDLNALFLPTAGSGVTDELTLTKTKEKAEILRITEALNKHRNNRLRAAAELGISRMALYKKLHKYGLYNSA